MTAVNRSAIVGLGVAVPDRILSNAELEKLVDTTDEWIFSRTGIRERRILSPGEKISDFAAEACRKAVENAGLTIDQIDMLIVCTFTGDQSCPTTACVVHGKLGMKDKPAVELNAACSGFIYGVQYADAMIRAGIHRNVLVVGAETQSRYVNYEDRGTCILFGDGAGAVVVGPTQNGNGPGILGIVTGADSRGTELITIEATGSVLFPTQEVIDQKRHLIYMNGREVFKFAVRTVGVALDEVLKVSNMKSEQVDLLVPHQANIRIIESAAERLGMSMDRVVVNIQKYGNTASASIPLALQDAVISGQMKPGMTIACVGFGAGFTYGAALIRW